jgi:hypothetical protein
MIEVPAQANAAQMLNTQAVCLGQIGDDQYFMLDGKVWRISGGVVFRSDDDLESRALLRKVKQHRAQAPPQPTDEQPLTDFNPDGLDADALWDFWKQTQQTCRQTARRLFPDRPRGYVRTTAALGNYAANKATALRQRARGDIPTAQTYEAICERIYDQLPDYARW